jgi:hypothetical protein
LYQSATIDPTGWAGTFSRAVLQAGMTPALSTSSIYMGRLSLAGLSYASRTEAPLARLGCGSCARFFSPFAHDE